MLQLGVTTGCPLEGVSLKDARNMASIQYVQWQEELRSISTSLHEDESTFQSIAIELERKRDKLLEAISNLGRVYG